MWRVVVCDQETSENEEAKTRYRAVKNITTMGCNGRKTNKQLINCTKKTSKRNVRISEYAARPFKPYQHPV
jgi:hypothetical protein